MKYPEFLPENGTIGFVAPSFGCSIEPYYTAFLNAQKKFAEMGHKSDLGPNCYASDGIGISNTPEACGAELTEYYCSDKNDILISCGGGELMCEILDKVDFDKIRKAKPKWYMGFSDNTNMTFLLTTLCDTASVYGPCAAAFGMEPWHENLWDAYHLLRGQQNSVHGYALWEKDSKKDEEHPLEAYNVTEEKRLMVYLPQEQNLEHNAAQTGGKSKIEVHPAENLQKKINMQGRLLGGCMDCLVNLPGTEFDKVKEFTEKYQNDGIIWFLESCDLNVMSIRRAVWQMKHAGWFSHVKGFLIGRPAVFGQEMMGLDQYHAVTDLLAEYQVPVIMDADIGHIPPMMPLVCGSYADVSIIGNQLNVNMTWK